MGIGTAFALVGLEMIPNRQRRAELRERLEANGRTVIPLTAAQIAAFAGNAMELEGCHGRVLALSTRALAALTPAQIAVIEQSARPPPLSVPTIERAGGSVRCMLAGVHLARRPPPPR